MPSRCGHEPQCPDLPAHQSRQRADWRRAAAKAARDKRTKRGKRPQPTYRAGMNVMPP